MATDSFSPDGRLRLDFLGRLEQMNCRIQEMLDDAERSPTMRIANAIFLSLCANYRDIDLRTYYEEALAFYTRITETEQAVIQQG